MFFCSCPRAWIWNLSIPPASFIAGRYASSFSYSSSFLVLCQNRSAWSWKNRLVWIQTSTGPSVTETTQFSILFVFWSGFEPSNSTWLGVFHYLSSTIEIVAVPDMDVTKLNEEQALALAEVCSKWWIHVTEANCFIFASSSAMPFRTVKWGTRVTFTYFVG